MSRSLVWVCTCWLCGSSVVAVAGDWTKFQGPLPADVQTARLPMTWSPDENILWNAGIPGYGQSSPVTWGDSVYVTSISGPHKDQCHVTAFDLRSGKKLWQHDLASATQAENNGYISKAAPTPAVDEHGVLCFFEGGNLLALSHDGQVRWQRNLVEEFGPIVSRHGLAASLEQMADRVFVWVERQDEPYLLAVDKVQGRDLWKVAGLGATSWSSPRLVPVGEDQHLVLSGVGHVVGINPVDGERLWEFTDIKGNSTPTPVPAGNGRFLIAATVGRGEADGGKASDSNGLMAIRRNDDGSYRAEFVWRAKRATSSFGSPAVHEGLAYYVNATGVLFCLDLETGEERYSNRLGDSIWATPLPLGDRIAFFGKGGKSFIVAAGPEFELLGENALFEELAAPPAETAARSGPAISGPVMYAAAVVRDRWLFRRGDRLYCVGPQAKSAEK